MAGVEYQVTKVDPTSTETKGMVYQVHSVSADEAASIPGKVFYAKNVADPTDTEVKGKVFQITLIDDPTDTNIKGKVFNAVISGLDEDVVVGPDVSPLSLPGAKAGSLKYVKAYGACEQSGVPTPDLPIEIECNNGNIKWDGNESEIYADGVVEKIKDSLNHETTAEMLLGIAGYKDEQDLISGDIIRRIGVVILDGYEDWSTTVIAGHKCFSCSFVSSGAFNHMFCTHFKNESPALSDEAFYRSSGEENLVIRYDSIVSGALPGQEITDFSYWLNNQYLDGSPVMIFYALDTPQTEKVTGQTLQVDDGTNALTITQASLTGLKLETKYTKAA